MCKVSWSKPILVAVLMGCGGGEEAPETSEPPPQEPVVAEQQEVSGEVADSVRGAVDSLQAAVGQREAPVRAPPVKESHPRRVVFTPGGRYLLQVGAYKNRSAADRAKADLRQMGYPAQAVPGRGVFRVRIGFFQKASEAESLGVRLKRDLGLEYWVANR